MSHSSTWACGTGCTTIRTPRPTQLKEAALQISRDVWNKYYAPVFHKKDVVLLGVYSHMIDSFLYLPDYPIGHLIAHQIEEKIRKSGAIGPEFERMAKIGQPRARPLDEERHRPARSVRKQCSQPRIVR